MHRNFIPVTDPSNTKRKRGATSRAEGAPLRQRLRTGQTSRAPVVTATVSSSNYNTRSRGSRAAAAAPAVDTSAVQPLSGTKSNSRARSRGSRAATAPAVDTTAAQPVPSTSSNSRIHTPRAVPRVIAFETDDSSDEEESDDEFENLDLDSFEEAEEAEVGVDIDGEGGTNYDVREVGKHDVVSRPISLALEKDAVLGLKKRGQKETESYASLINTLVFGGTMYDSAAAVTGTDPDDPKLIEEMENAVLDQITVQGAYIADNTKNAYRSALADYKRFCDIAYKSRADPYLVSERKMCVFLTEYLFKKTIQKHINPSKRKQDRTFPMFRKDISETGVEINAASRTFDFQEYLNRLSSSTPSATTMKRWTVEVPYGTSKIEQTVSCLIHLQSLQKSRPVNPSQERQFFYKKGLIGVAVKGYARQLVGGILRSTQSRYNEHGELVQIGREVSTNALATNHYSVAEHIRCLLNTWRQPVETRGIGQREHFTLAVRHSMLLRDGDLRGIDIANMSMETLPMSPGGIQKVVALVFTMFKDKSNQLGHPQEGIAIRHHDVRRCSIGALAFYMFDRFEVKREAWIDTESPTWTSKKLIGNGGSNELSPSASYSSTQAVFAAELLTCSNVTHSGQHSGAREAVRLNCPEEEISAGGRWPHNSGKLQQHYLAKRPITFARYMARCNDKPFHLKRNEVVPPLELQRLIFEFIEKAYGEEGSEENRIWRLECDQEMLEMDVNNDEDLDNLEPYEFTPARSSGTSQSQTATWASMRSNKKFVLKTLLRLRRVLLQDAAEYLYRYKPEHSPLLQAHDLFTNPLFVDFKAKVASALARPDKCIPNNLPPNIMSALDAWYKETHAGLAESNKKMEDLDGWMAWQENLFRELFKHTCWANNMMADIKSDTQNIRGTQPPPPTTYMREAAFTPGGQSHVFAQGFQPFVMPSTSQFPVYRSGHHQQQQQQQKPHQKSQQKPHQKSQQKPQQKQLQQATLTQSRPLRPALAPEPSQQRPPPPPMPSFPEFGRRGERRETGASGVSEAGVLPQSAEGPTAGPSNGGSAPVPVPSAKAKQWFVSAGHPPSTRALYDEYMLFLDLSAANNKSDLTPRTIKQMSDRKTVYDQIQHLRTTNMAAGLSEEDALDSACTEIDNKVRELTGARAGEPYNKNQAVVYCRAERIQRDLDAGKVIRNRGRTKKNDNDNPGSKCNGKDKGKSNDESSDDSINDEEWE